MAGTVSADVRVSLAFALGLGCATSLCLTALFSARYRLEDPFAAGEADTVDVPAEFARLRAALRAPPPADEAAGDGATTGADAAEPLQG